MSSLMVQIIAYGSLSIGALLFICFLFFQNGSYILFGSMFIIVGCAFTGYYSIAYQVPKEYTIKVKDTLIVKHGNSEIPTYYSCEVTDERSGQIFFPADTDKKEEAVRICKQYEIGAMYTIQYKIIMDSPKIIKKQKFEPEQR